MRFLSFFLLVFIIIACKDKTPPLEDKENQIIEKKIEETTSEEINEEKPKEELLPEENKEADDKKDLKSEFKEITSMSGIVIDIKYATEDNFTKKQIYDCGKCFLRPEATNKIVEAHKAIKKKHGYGLKMFDCYRPLPAQQRLWDVVPNADYVTPPSKGSMHNRGLAVDLTLVDKDGKELDMGTAYDFFGKEAHTDNMSLPKQVLENRKILKDAMNEVGFKGIRTEWWHFSLDANASLASWEWKCN